jgi:Fe-S cluster assembly protein SufD
MMSGSTLDSIITESQVIGVSRANSEPSWLLDRRIAALREFNASELPSRRLVEWRYTDPSRIEWRDLKPPSCPNEPCSDVAKVRALEGFEGLIDHACVAIHCEDCPTLLNIPNSWLERNVYISDLRTAMSGMPSHIESRLNNGGIKGADKFTHLHEAVMDSAIFVRVPASTKLTEPFFNISWFRENNTLHSPRINILVEENARLNFVDIVAGPGGSNVVIPFYDIVVKRGGSLKYLRLEQASHSSTILGYQEMTLCADSTVISAVVNLGGALVRDDIRGRLAEQGSNLTMLGVNVPGNGQHFDSETLQEHTAPHCRSELLFKSALSGKSRSVFNGKITVAPNAQKTDAYQINRNILLSKEARADSVPQLEIKANDVRCSHGATVSRVRVKDVFYLMSRGLSRQLAEETLVFGFLDEVIAKLAWQEMAVPLQCRISQRIKSW